MAALLILMEMLLEKAQSPDLVVGFTGRDIDPKTDKIERAQEWLGHTSTAHTRAYIDAEDCREKGNGVVAGLDI
jgi:hypothetical protein